MHSPPSVCRSDTCSFATFTHGLEHTAYPATELPRLLIDTAGLIPPRSQTDIPPAIAASTDSPGSVEPKAPSTHAFPALTPAGTASSEPHVVYQYALHRPAVQTRGRRKPGPREPSSGVSVRRPGDIVLDGGALVVSIVVRRWRGWVHWGVLCYITGRRAGPWVAPHGYDSQRLHVHVHVHARNPAACECACADRVT